MASEKKSRCVRWNEEKLLEIELNKPVRQKITEPPTPYPMIDDTGPSPVVGSFNDCINDAMVAKELSSAPKDVASSSTKTTDCSGGCTSSADETGGTMDSEEDCSKSFQEQRKAHYDEYFKIKEQRHKGSSLEEEDDGVEGDSSSSLSVEDGGVTLPGTGKTSAEPATGFQKSTEQPKT